MNLMFWREAVRTGDKHAIEQCDAEFHAVIQSALDNGIATQEDEICVTAIDWTDTAIVHFEADQEGILVPTAAD